MIKKVTNGGRSGFTLLELLIVIGIMALLMAMALPAFENLSKRGLTSAAPALMSTLRLARQHAITTRKYVWVVFPDIGSGGAQGGALAYSGSQVEKALRSYAVIEGDANNKPSQYITDWKFLPQGMYFENKGGSDVLKSYDTLGSTAYYPFPNSTSSSNYNMPAIQFRPNGRAYKFNGSWNSTGVHEIFLMSGIVNVDTNASVVVGAPIKVATNNAEIRVFLQTGQLDFTGQ